MKVIRWQAIVTLVLWMMSGISAQALEVLTVAPLPVAVAFTLTGDSTSNQGLTPIVVVTTWTTLSLSRTGLSLYGYFASASAALTNLNPSATTAIPASRIEVSVNGGTSQPFDQTIPFGPPTAGRQLFSQSLSVLQLTGLRTDTLTLNINLSGYTLPAGTYVGVLHFRARATP